MDKHAPHKIGLYVRVSTEEQAANPEGSIKNQEERLRETVRFKNMDGPFGEVAAVYVDRRSGKDTNRAELQRLLSAIRRKEITLLMVTELSRLSRSIKDFSGIWELMQDSGCQLMSLRENFDTTTAAGEMVLYIVANIAQFERRQVSERVAANFKARAARGLYNGGMLPVGYRLIPDRPGFLEVDEGQAMVVRTAFDALLKEKTLSRAAKWLNANGHRVSRVMQGGGSRPRLGYFTVENLSVILTNKAYLGIRTYRDGDGVKEVKAVWPSLIDETTFQRVQDILALNRKRKPESEVRYPFAHSGYIYCKACGAHMVGKSAHGNGGKVPYYEHGWATRREGCLVKPCFSCKPFRVQAKILEAAVWANVKELLTDPARAAAIIEAAKAIHKERAKTSGSHDCREKISALKTQLEVLAERLALIPKNVSVEPVFRQMEKIESLKQLEEERLKAMGGESGPQSLPAGLRNYGAFLAALAALCGEQEDPGMRAKIAQALIHRILITEEGYEIEWIAGRDEIEEGLRSTAPPDAKKPGIPQRGCRARIFSVHGSNNLTNGG